MSVGDGPGDTAAAMGGQGCAEIVDDKDAHRAGTASGMPCRLNLADQLADALSFVFAYLLQGVPELRLKSHARAAAAGHHVAVD